GVTGGDVVGVGGGAGTQPVGFILVGTMNPEEGELRPQLLDRFGLCVDVEGIDDPDLRVEIAERDAAFRTGDPGFGDRFRDRDSELATALKVAMGTLPQGGLTP